MHANIISVKRYVMIPLLLFTAFVIMFISVFTSIEYIHDQAEKPLSPSLVLRGSITSNGGAIAYNSSSITKRLWGPKALLESSCNEELEKIVQLKCEEIQSLPHVNVDTPYAWVELREQRQQADSTRFLVGTHTPGGNTGLEAALDLVLSTRFVFSKTSTQPTVETTIDAGLQKITDDYVSQIADQLGPERAWIVIISNEGDILAGSAFTKNKAGSSPLYQELFEPGSIFKPLVMAWALDVGAIDTSFTVYSPGVTQIDGITIRDWKFLGTVDLTKALQQSSNIYMATVAKKTGYDRLIAGLKRYGMDDPVLHFPGEAKSILPQNTQASLLNAGFGQGVALTPLQFVRAYTAIANNGLLYNLRLVKSITVGDQHIEFPTATPTRVVSPESANIVRNIMKTIATPTVSAAAVPYKGKYFNVAAKSGTAQVPVNGQYNQTDRLYSYVGLLPGDNPEMILLISIDRPQKISPSLAVYVAAPWFRQVVRDVMLFKGFTP